MIKTDKIVAAAMTSLLALTAGITDVYAQPANPQPEMEKCYGISKAHMNDCKTDSASCASSATQDSQPDAFLFVPQGLCNKIVGGQLKTQDTEKK